MLFALIRKRGVSHGRLQCSYGAIASSIIHMVRSTDVGACKTAVDRSKFEI